METHSFFDPLLVQRALHTSGIRSGEELPLELDRAWPLAGGGLCALWRNEDGERLWPVIRPARDKESDLLSCAIGKREAVRLRELEGYGLLFPFDPALPQLAALSGMHDSVPVSRFGNDDRTLLRYKPLRRCVFHLGEGEESRYVKCVRPRAVQGLAGLYRLLRSAPTLEFAAPQEVWRDFGALVWQRSPGALLTHRLNGSYIEETIAATGRNLAALHTSALRLPAIHERDRELETLRSWVDLVRTAFPERDLEMTRALARLENPGRTLPTGRLLPAHRDFHDGQVLVDGSRVVFLDFDTAALAEAELDVGNFLAHLDLRSLEQSDVSVDRLAAVFIGAYRSHGGPSLHGGRLDWYHACALLRLASVYSFRSGGRDLSEGLLNRLFNDSDQALRTEVS